MQFGCDATPLRIFQPEEFLHLIGDGILLTYPGRGSRLRVVNVGLNMPTYAETIELAHKRQLLSDTERASALGLNTYEYRAQRKTAITDWTAIIRKLMDESNARDPIEILPELCVRLLEDIRAVAKAEAGVSARSVVQRMLKRATTPL